MPIIYRIHAWVFVVDSWVAYKGKEGARIWLSPDVPLVNFSANTPGEMTFEFDLAFGVVR